MAQTDTSLPGFTCGNDPQPPPLKATARAGSDIVIQWTDVPRHHLGPSMDVSLVSLVDRKSRIGRIDAMSD
jgi:hypothetical protein